MAAATARTTLEIEYRPLNLFGFGFPMPPSWTSSAVFGAGGYEWRAHVLRSHNAGGPRTGFYLQLVTKNARATASMEVCIVDSAGRLLSRRALSMPPTEFDSSTDNAGAEARRNHKLGAECPDSHLNMPLMGYIDVARDSLVLEITVTVFSDKASRSAAMPPSDLMEQLEELFTARDEGGDVAFSLEGEPVRAHRTILAMRSPVFKAMLYGPMKESSSSSQSQSTTLLPPPPQQEQESIEIEGMRREVFEALLAYIYTDALPAGAGDDDMVWGLLVAADRYGVDRLRAICERRLCGKLDVQNVARFLGVADQYHLHALKDACIEFMTTSARMDEIVQTQEYTELRATRLHLLAEVLEKSTKFRSAMFRSKRKSLW